MRDLINFIPLDAILTRIYPLMPKEYVTEDNILEWASEAMEELTTYKAYQQKICVTEVINHKVPIPVGLYGLEMILKQVYPEDATDKVDISDITTWDSEEPSYAPTESVVDFLINPKILRGWTPLAISDSILDMAVLCNDSPLLEKPDRLRLRCEHVFSIDFAHRQFVTSFESGKVAIAYLSAPMNDAGQFLIPNNEHLKKAIEAYCMKRIWESRLNHGDDRNFSMRMYLQYSKEYELLSTKTVGEQLMPSLSSYANLRNLNKMVREDSRFAAGLGNLGNQERIYFGL